MTNPLLKAFFEDLAVIRDSAWVSAQAALLDDGNMWVSDIAAFERLRSTLRSDEDVESFTTAIEEFVHIAIHSVLVAIDGGSASAEVGRVQLVDENAESLGDGLHELFVDYLFETGRME